MLHPNQNFIQNTSNVILIGGADSSGGAGIQTDQKMLNSLEVDSRAVITAITSQTHKNFNNIQYASGEMVKSQFETALFKNDESNIIKLGMLGNLEIVETLFELFKDKNYILICDPVLISTTGRPLLSNEGIQFFKNNILPLVTLLTPNIMEAESLLGEKIQGPLDVEKAAKALLELGVKNVLIKGGHLEEKGPHSPNYSHDYYYDGAQGYWISGYRNSFIKPVRGTGCALASSIAGGLASGLDLRDSLVLGKILLQKSIRNSFEQEDAYLLNPKGTWKDGVISNDFPWVTTSFPYNKHEIQFPFMELKEDRTNLYPIVDRAEWLEKLYPLGIKLVQLRIKDLEGDELEKEIEKAVTISKKYKGQLFINDYWELAIKYNAYGVHLGYEDMLEANMKKIADAKLHMGLSTHCYFEAAQAHGLNPSYIAFGPIYYTALKAMKFKPQGIENLKLWRSLFDCPLVAIGGINLNRVSDIMECGPEIISVVRDITLNKSPSDRVMEYQSMLLQ